MLIPKIPGHQQGLRLAKPAGQATTELSISSLRAASITLVSGLILGDALTLPFLHMMQVVMEQADIICVVQFKGLEEESQAIFMSSLKEVTATSKALQRTAEGECSSTSEMLCAAQTVVDNFRGQRDTRSAAVRDAKQTFDKAVTRVEQEQLAR